MYIKYIDEWLHPCVRKVDSVSIRSSEVEETDMVITCGWELYDPALGSGFQAEGDMAALQWFSSKAAASMVLDKLCAALDAGKQVFDLTAYGEDGEEADGRN